MSRLFGLSCVLAASLTIAGCASAPKQPLTFDQLGQFAAYPLNSQSYRISFQARPNLSYATAEEITLVKAAQTTLNQGFSHFKVLDDPSNRAQQAPRQAVVYSSSHYYPYGFYSRRPYYGMTHFLTNHASSILILFKCPTALNVIKIKIHLMMILMRA